jgi:thioredoxin-like negative regulator of GroEL
MDVTILANDLTSVIAPFVPYLIRMGERSAEEAGRRLGEDAWTRAKALWAKLGGRLQERPVAVETVREVAEVPDDTDVRAALAVQLRRILAADAALAEEVRRLLADWPAGSGGTTVAAASGERSIAVGRDAIQSVFRTGDEVADSD